MFDNDDDTDEENRPDESNDEAEDESPYGGFVFEGSDDSEPEDGAEEDDENVADRDVPESVRVWTLGSHSTATDEERDAISEVIAGLDDEVDDDLKGVLQDAAGMVGGQSVSNFECPVCGLNHGHADYEHDIRRDPNSTRGKAAGFGVTDEFASRMEGCPYCHCGVNELAMLIDFFNHIGVPMFEDQHHFEGVRELPNDVLQDIMQAYRDLGNGGGMFTIRDAVKDSGHARHVPKDLEAELEMFYQRWSDIKRAANGAPIPGEFRERIEEGRAILVARTA